MLNMDTTESSDGLNERAVTSPELEGQEEGTNINQITDEVNYRESEDVPAENEDNLKQTKANEVLANCLSDFATVDFIMEPTVFSQLKTYFRFGGNPETVVRELSDNYQAVAQTVNIMAEWLILLGVEIGTVQQAVEAHLREMLVRNFDPKRADTIFTAEGEAPAWLTEMLEFPVWRGMFYKLAEEYPECLMLNFVIKLISDMGLQAEITSVATTAQQLEVFSRVCLTFVQNYREAQDAEDTLQQLLQDFVRLACHGEHTYLYSQALLHTLDETISEADSGGHNVRRLAEELESAALQQGLEVTPITLAMLGASAYPRAAQALFPMLTKAALNPADMTVLYKLYSSNDPPPARFLRLPRFLDLFLDTLFRPSATINPEHRQKYIYVLAYAASVVEEYKQGRRVHLNNDEHAATRQSLEKAQLKCSRNKSSSELVSDIGALYTCLKYPVVAIGVLKWISFTVTEDQYFLLNSDPKSSVHLALLDEISTNHPLLHKKVLALIVQLFESSLGGLDDLVQLEVKKVLLERMVHLLSRGYVLPVMRYIRQCRQRDDTDISLIRHFVVEVLDMVAPPYTTEFMQASLPLIDDIEITGPLQLADSSDAVSQFLTYCRTHHQPS